MHDSIIGRRILNYTERAGDDKAADIALKLFNLKDIKRLSRLKLQLMGRAGFIYQQKGITDKALHFHNLTYERSLAVKDTFNIINAIYRIGYLHYNMSQYRKAYESFNSIKGYLTSKNGAMESRLKYVMAEVCFGLDSMEQGTKLLKEAIDYLEKKDRSDFLIHAYATLSRVYLSKNNYDQAELYAKKISEVAKELKRDPVANVGADMLIDIYNKKGEYQKALALCKQIEPAVDKLAFNSNRLGFAFRMYQTYNYLNNTSEALRYLKKAYDLRDTLFKIDNAKNMNDMAEKYESEKKNLEIEKQKLEVEKKNEEKNKVEAQKKQQTIIFLIVALVLIINGVFFYNRYKLSQKQNAIIEEQKSEVEHQKNLVEEKQKEIIDSINYAKRIQYTLLAHHDFIKENLNDFFVYFQPKDIVSGDFYWATKRKNLFYLAVCDSTGHGVPGAFMSLLNTTFLNEAINERAIENPGEILDFVRQRLIDNISKEGQQDGFDGILICLDTNTKKLSFAAANNAPVLVKSLNNELSVMQSDRMPVGIGAIDQPFKTFSLDYTKGDMLYLYTDGYADQFGGPKGKKFKYKQLNELLLSISAKSMHEQQDILQQRFEAWRNNLEQVDDVAVIGIKL